MLAGHGGVGDANGVIGRSTDDVLVLGQGKLLAVLGACDANEPGSGGDRGGRGPGGRPARGGTGPGPTRRCPGRRPAACRRGTVGHANHRLPDEGSTRLQLVLVSQLQT
ncbi:hypothetical protein A176_002249 [Myxococcus hansupus]|uniref:Uncharacterized protein n=1 Tax=Pseudomyxococcus hansupus TaxID=1297742 RepID=A0A0H4XBM6_9BACT|nr:hypothetical protein A176_002249 [Myxococcus hansupus]